MHTEELISPLISPADLMLAARDFLVTEAEKDARLDAFLAARFPDISRTRWQQAISDELVLVNKKIAKPSLRLRIDDAIEVELDEILTNVAPTDVAPEDAPLDIIYEDESLVVINKPAGLVVHPGAGNYTGTLVNRLVFHFQKLGQTQAENQEPPNAQNSGINIRPGIVHRLDADTSGLLVIAKTDFAHEHLSAQFRERQIEKHYFALVHGVVERTTGIIEKPIGRDPRQRTRMSIVPVGGGGRYALTQYKVARRYTRFTLLDVDLKTGRTHQIRVHLASIKYPIVGDAAYNLGRDNQITDVHLRNQVKGLNRQLLHAATLAFLHPTTGERLTFRAPLPTDLQTLLDEIESA